MRLNPEELEIARLQAEWWADAEKCDCGGQLDDDNDCLECGTHSMTGYEKVCEAAEWRYESQRDDHVYQEYIA